MAPSLQAVSLNKDALIAQSKLRGPPISSHTLQWLLQQVVCALPDAYRQHTLAEVVLSLSSPGAWGQIGLLEVEVAALLTAVGLDEDQPVNARVVALAVAAAAGQLVDAGSLRELQLPGLPLLPQLTAGGALPAVMPQQQPALQQQQKQAGPSPILGSARSAPSTGRAQQCSRQAARLLPGEGPPSRSSGASDDDDEGQASVGWLPWHAAPSAHAPPSGHYLSYGAPSAHPGHSPATPGSLVKPAVSVREQQAGHGHLSPNPHGQRAGAGRSRLVQQLGVRAAAAAVLRGQGTHASGLSPRSLNHTEPPSPAAAATTPGSGAQSAGTLPSSAAACSARGAPAQEGGGGTPDSSEAAVHEGAESGRASDAGGDDDTGEEEEESFHVAPRRQLTFAAQLKRTLKGLQRAPFLPWPPQAACRLHWV